MSVSLDQLKAGFPMSRMSPQKVRVWESESTLHWPHFTKDLGLGLVACLSLDAVGVTFAIE